MPKEQVAFSSYNNPTGVTHAPHQQSVSKAEPNQPGTISYQLQCSRLFAVNYSQPTPCKAKEMNGRNTRPALYGRKLTFVTAIYPDIPYHLPVSACASLCPLKNHQPR